MVRQVQYEATSSSIVRFISEERFGAEHISRQAYIHFIAVWVGTNQASWDMVV